MDKTRYDFSAIKAHFEGIRSLRVRSHCAEIGISYQTFYNVLNGNVEEVSEATIRKVITSIGLDPDNLKLTVA